ncbi:MAG: MBL fold metallo-hydrolase [Bacilli bacterium]|nr:MBL fold metallo-hydrolase [Bacilli bacterium]
MRVIVLSSESKGNTTYIECNDTKILIDMGNTCKYVVNKLEGIGIKAEEIDAIFITHTHSDHVKGLKVFLKKYGTKVYFTRMMKDELEYVDNYELIDKDEIKLKDLIMHIIKTSHDVADSVGYVIEGDNRGIVYITDTGYINNKYFNLLSNREVYILESNHDIEMLNNGSYSFKLRQRILGDKGHLSNYDSARYLSSFIGDKTNTIVLAHLSEENNTRDLAYKTLKQRLDDNNQLVDRIMIAKQDEETEEILV